jgi:membrane fusion protein (multidrug efflux system)
MTGVRTAAAAALAAAGLAVACGDGKAGGASVGQGLPPATVEAVTVVRRTLRQTVALVGQLEAAESVEVKPETSGIVESVHIDEGGEVARGALLFRLRDDQQRAVLGEAEARRALAEQAFGRARTLFGQRILSRDEFDRARAERDAAEARAQLARVELERTEIRAPFDGVLGARLVSPGDRVTDETALVRLDAIATLKLAFTVPETAVPLARLGMPVRVAVAPYPGERFDGEVFFVAPALDAASRRLLLKATVPNPGRRLRPGLFATIDVEVARREAALSVPESAVVHDASGPGVWRVTAEGTAERVPVTLGLRQPPRVEVTAGLAPGDRVVASGTHKVAPGAPLHVVEPAAAEAGAPAADP